MKKQILLVGISTLSFLLSPFYTFAYTQEEFDWAVFMSWKGYIVDYSQTPEKYRLDDSITRREMMKVIANMGGATLQNTCEGKFSDVKSNDWGCKYIEWALSQSYIANNSTFRPDDRISKIEALKMIFKVQAIEKTVNTWNWQQDYVETAYGKSWYEDKWTDYGSAATRGWIFMSANRVINDIKVGPIDDTDKILNELIDLLQ